MSSRICQDSRSHWGLPRFSRNRRRTASDLLAMVNDHFESLGVRLGRLGPFCDLILERTLGTGYVNAQTSRQAGELIGRGIPTVDIEGCQYHGNRTMGTFACSKSYTYIRSRIEPRLFEQTGWMVCGSIGKIGHCCPHKIGPKWYPISLTRGEKLLWWDCVLKELENGDIRCMLRLAR